MEQLRKGQILDEPDVLKLCNKAKEILIEEANVQRVDTPVTVRMARMLCIYHSYSSAAIFTGNFLT